PPCRGNDRGRERLPPTKVRFHLPSERRPPPPGSLFGGGILAGLAGLGLPLGEEGVELSLGHGDLVGGLGPTLRGAAIQRLGVVLGAFADTLLELLRRLADGTGQLGQLGRPEEQQHDDEDDDELERSDVRHRPQSLQAWARISRSSGPGTENGIGLGLTTSVDTPSASHPASWSRTSSTVPTSRPRRQPSSDAPPRAPGVVDRRCSKRRPRSAGSSPISEYWPRERVTVAGSRPARSQAAYRVSRRSWYRSGVQIQAVLHPSATRATRSRRRSPDPPTQIGGDGCCSGRGRHMASVTCS